MITGGVTSMKDFLLKFFPKIYHKEKEKHPESNYCKYNDQGLQLLISLFYLAGLIATLFASYTTRRLGRRLTMLIAGAFFIAVLFSMVQPKIWPCSSSVKFYSVAVLALLIRSDSLINHNLIIVYNFRYIYIVSSRKVLVSWFSFNLSYNVSAHTHLM